MTAAQKIGEHKRDISQEARISRSNNGSLLSGVERANSGGSRAYRTPSFVVVNELQARRRRPGQEPVLLAGPVELLGEEAIPRRAGGGIHRCSGRHVFSRDPTGVVVVVTGRVLFLEMRNDSRTPFAEFVWLTCRRLIHAAAEGSCRVNVELLANVTNLLSSVYNVSYHWCSCRKGATKDR